MKEGKTELFIKFRKGKAVSVKVPAYFSWFFPMIIMFIVGIIAFTILIFFKLY